MLWCVWEDKIQHYWDFLIVIFVKIVVMSQIKKFSIESKNLS